MTSSPASSSIPEPPRCRSATGSAPCRSVPCGRLQPRQQTDLVRRSLLGRSGPPRTEGRGLLIFSKRSQPDRAAAGTQGQEAKSRRSSAYGHRRSGGLETDAPSPELRGRECPVSRPAGSAGVAPSGPGSPASPGPRSPRPGPQPEHTSPGSRPTVGGGDPRWHRFTPVGIRWRARTARPESQRVRHVKGGRLSVQRTAGRGAGDADATVVRAGRVGTWWGRLDRMRVADHGPVTAGAPRAPVR